MAIGLSGTCGARRRSASGRACCRCCSAAPSTRSRSSRRRSCSGLASAAPREPGWRATIAASGRAAGAVPGRRRGRRRMGAPLLLNREFPYWPIDPALAAGPVVQLPDRSAARAARGVAGRVLLGRELSARARRRWAAPTAIRRRVVGRVYARQHDWRDRRRRSSFSLLIIPGLGHAGRAAACMIWPVACLAAVVMLVWHAPADARTPAGTPRRRARALAALVRRGLGLGQRRADSARPDRVRPSDRDVQGRALPVRRRRAELVDRGLGVRRAASGTSTSAARSKRRPKSTTCACSGCWGTCPR